MSLKALRLVIALLLAALLAAACGAPAPDPIPTPMLTTPSTAARFNTTTPSPAATLTPTATLSPSPTTTPTVTPTPTSAIVLEPGWVLYQEPEDGFAIALPPGWNRIDLDPKTLEASLEVLKKQDPQLASTLEGQANSLATQNFKFFAFDLSPDAVKTSFAANANLLGQSLAGEASLDFYAEVNVGQLENLHSVIRPVTHKRVTLLTGKAEQIQYRMRINQASGKSLTLAVTQYLFIQDGEIYILTLSAPSSRATFYATVFEKIARSFELVK